MIRSTLPLALALALGGSLALAQESGGTEGDMDHSGMAMSDMPGHPQDMMGVMDTMMQSMPMESTGNVDADFLLMMIPHHQSAIDMARIEVEQGQDEETRAMAQVIIDLQEAEIAEMRTMLERMGVEPPAASETVTTDDSGMAEGEPASE